MKYLIALLTLCLPLSASADFARCLLDRLPGVQNDVAASAIWQTCLTRYPGGLEAVAQGADRGFFGYSSGAECTAAKSSSTSSRKAALGISYACDRLYDPPPDPRAADKLFEDLKPHR